MPTPYKLFLHFEKLFLKSWWVILFAIFCLMFYEQGERQQCEVHQTLSQHLEKLQSEKTLALSIQEDLTRQINSQSDPAWIEMTLMKELGVIPEGTTKVFFTPRPQHTK